MIDVGPCSVSAGTCIGGATITDDTDFESFQNSGGCPIGLYVEYSYGLPPEAPPS